MFKESSKFIGWETKLENKRSDKQKVFECNGYLFSCCSENRLVHKGLQTGLTHMRSFRYLPSGLWKQIRDCVLPSRFFVLLDLLAKGPPFSMAPGEGAAWSESERLVTAGCWLAVLCGWSGLDPEILSRELSRLKASRRINSEPRLWLRLGMISAVSESAQHVISHKT